MKLLYELLEAFFFLSLSLFSVLSTVLQFGFYANWPIYNPKLDFDMGRVLIGPP